MARFTLSANETVERELQPHPVAFADLWAIWTAYLLIALFFLLLRNEIGPAVAGTGLGQFLARFLESTVVPGLLNVVLLTLATVSGAVWIAFLRINLWWLLLPVLIGVGMVVILFTVDSAREAGGTAWLYLIPAGVSILAMSQIELYRRGHHFYVTNRRLVFERRYPLAPYTTVEAYYPHITNLMTKQTALERLLGAGTVIPVMSSGLNLGSEVMSLSGGILFFTVSSSREKKKPRALPYMSFYAVRNPHEVAGLIGPHVTGEEK